MVITGLCAALMCVVVMPSVAAKTRHAEQAGRPDRPAELASVPLPQPRPPGAPSRDQHSDQAKAPSAAGKDEPAKHDQGAAQVEPPQPSACRVALTEDIAIAPTVPAIHGPGDCGGDDLVRLEAVVLPNKKRVALTPAATMRCPMAAELAEWVRSDVATVAAKLGSEIAALDNFDSYQCRGRNGKSGAPLSEHGRANAIDVHGFKLTDGRMIDLTDRTQPREVRESLLHSACTRFTTVLGPDSDGYHEDHIHLDLLQRRNDYRICQWDVLDPMPQVAPLMPEQRPAEAPPREFAGVEQGSPSGKGAADAGDAKPSQDHPADQTTGADARHGQPVPEGNAGKDRATVPTAPLPARAAEPTTSSVQRESRPANQPPSPPAQGSSKVTAAPARSDNDKASVEPAPAKPSADKAGPQKNAGRKVAADRSAPKKRPRRSRAWNPFASFF